MSDHALIAGSALGVPEWLVAVAALLTQLGDAWFLYLGLGLLYWLGDRRLAANPRRVGATLIAVGLGALAVTVGLKSLFAFGRPPGAAEATAPLWLPAVAVDAYAGAATGDGFSFPSGHAIGATMVYGGLATFLDVWDRRTRLRVAGVLIAVVALTRVVLGVHYVVDVAAGVAVGVAGLLLFQRVARSGFRPHPDRAFFLAAGLGLVATAVAAAGGHGDEVLEAAIAFGGGLGGYAVWRVRGTETAPVGRIDTVVGLGVIAAVFGSAYWVATAGLPYVFGVVPDTTPFRLLAVVPLSFAGVAVVVAWPTLVARARGSDRPGDAGVDESESAGVADLITEAEPVGDDEADG
ncbi:phosphatase PAP2 family protein [Halobaculum lipolyticum]|uniref:Phosphatase PAP2 family protein n=1 Tax=Halobaculum lipolyticum TaxID=3032001 RepID=A0ABD5WF55_9EURY|nr:phosphatase PAP2 family protein [Halobaculum sp. DT31]